MGSGSKNLGCCGKNAKGVVMESWSNTGGGVADLRDTVDKIQSYGADSLA